MRSSVQNIPRAHRTSGHQLNELATSLYGPHTLVFYSHNHHALTGKIGWHLTKAGNTSFIGINWVQAKRSIQNNVAEVSHA